MSHMDLQRARATMVREWRAWAERVAEAARKTLPNAEIYVLGSAVRGDYTGGSDVDILVVSDAVPKGLLQRAETKSLMEEEAGLPSPNPIEIHLAKHSEAQNYLSRAGKDIIKL